MQNDPQLLDMMLQDQFKQKGLYHPGPYWKGYSSRVERAIRSEGLQNFRANNRIGKGFADTLLINPFDLLSSDSWKTKAYKRIVGFPIFKRYVAGPYIKLSEFNFQQAQKYKNLYYANTLGNWFSLFSKQYSLPETLVGNPQDTISINNYKIGRSYLTSFIRAYNYSKTIDFSKIESVFEIGGGFGSMCHTLLHLFPNIRKYLYLDIPPIIYVGTQYLKHFYKDEVIDYRQTRKLSSIRFSENDTREIIAACPWEIGKIDAGIDLFWNSASFQEMTKDMVANYAKHIKRMLNDKESRLCLYIYKGGNPEKTLTPKELLEIITNNVSVEFEELEEEHEITNAHYFVGCKK